MIIPVGATHRVELVVTEDMTAAKHAPGTMAVMGTPVMIGMMENASLLCLQKLMDATYSSVGTHVDIYHEAPAVIGMTVWAEAEILSVSENGKMVTFAVKAWTEKGQIGHGTHTRAVINIERFLARQKEKA